MGEFEKRKQKRKEAAARGREKEKNRAAHALGFFWAAHALEEILGAAHALKGENGQQLGGGRKRAAAGRFFLKKKIWGQERKPGTK